MDKDNNDLGALVGYIIGGAIIYGIGKGIGYILDKFDAESKKELEAKERTIWNNGKCPHCGSNWHARAFYPKGSGGEYEHIALTCKKCKIKSELSVIKPIETTNEYTVI